MHNNLYVPILIGMLAILHLYLSLTQPYRLFMHTMHAAVGDNCLKMLITSFSIGKYKKP